MLATPAAHGQTPVSRTAEWSGRLAEFNTNNLLVPSDEILPGGPPKDGIASLVNPSTSQASEVEFLDTADRVVGVTIAGQSRAYPIGVLNWHEVVNDEGGGVPIAVIYCPLCDSVSVVDRRIGDSVLTFGVSGLILNSNVLLYDRQDHALWSQLSLGAISGPHAGATLRHLPWEMTRFQAWRHDRPHSTVVNLDTGYRHDYSRNPYTKYFAENRLMFPVSHRDDRLRPRTPVIGVTLGTASWAYPVSRLAYGKKQRILDQLGGHQISLEIHPSRGRVSVEQLPDHATSVYCFWFAWAAFHPETTVRSLDNRGRWIEQPPAADRSTPTHARDSP